jgi:hypothetical protein
LPGGSDDSITEVTIAGVPNGATLSAGTDNGDGTWTLSPNDLTGLQITPPANSNVDFTLQVSATSEDVDPETGAVTTTSTAVDLPVTVLGVADDPTVSAGNVSGDEDTAIDLDISAGLTDTDGSETLSVTIAGVPVGAVLSLGTDNGDGTWTIDDPAEVSQLNNLTFTPPQDFFGDINLAVSSTATEDDSGDTATTGPANFTISVSDTGEVIVGTPGDDVLSGGNQDDIIQGLGGDDILEGGQGDDTLEGGADNDAIIGGYGNDALDGGTGFDTAFYAGDFDEYSISIADNGEVTISGPEGTDTLNNIENLDFKNGQVCIEDIGKAPTVETQAATGREDNAISLGITVAVANPLALVTGVTIANIPAGSVVAAGTDNPFELTQEADGTMSLTLTEDQLSGLNITPPQDFNGVFDLVVSATTSEGVTSNPVNYTVDVEAVNDAPELSGDGQIDVTGGAATISNQDMKLSDVDNSADELFYEVTDGPDHGDLFLDGNLLGEGDMFTQEDIDQGLLQYVADETGGEFNHEWAEGTPEWAGTGRNADINPIDPSNLMMPDGGNSVTINFESEGTSKNDVFGWYKIDENGNPGEASIIWGDTQDVDSGSSFTIEGLQPGESFGLFVVNDGADHASWLNDVPSNHTLGFNEDGNLAQFNRAGNEVHETGRAKDVFSNATSGVGEDGNLKIGFENTSISSQDDYDDLDYDDLVVSIQYNGDGGPADNDSFSFTAKDDSGAVIADQDSVDNNDGSSDGGYSVSEGQATVNINIDPNGVGG